MKPPSLLDPKFVYVPSVETDLRKTFERIRRMQNNENCPSCGLSRLNGEHAFDCDTRSPFARKEGKP